MIRTLSFLVVTSLVSCNDDSGNEYGGWESGEWISGNSTDPSWEPETTTVRIWKRKKPAYWEFPMTSSTEPPDVSAEYCKDVDMAALGANITAIVSAPVRGQAEPLLHMVVEYVLTLHRFIRKTNTTDKVAIDMARALVGGQRPQFMDMQIDLPNLHKRVGFDKYELQHFGWVMDDIRDSWQRLKAILFGGGGNDDG